MREREREEGKRELKEAWPVVKIKNGRRVSSGGGVFVVVGGGDENRGDKRSKHNPDSSGELDINLVHVAKYSC